MEQYFIKDYTGGSFVLFDTTHLCVLGGILLLNILLVIYGKRITPEASRTIRPIMATVLLGNEIGWHIWNVATGQWSLQATLPLHACSIFVVLNTIMLIFRSEKIFPFSYLIGIIAAIQALTTPDCGIYGFPHYRAVQTFIAHGLIVTSSVYMAVVEGMRPTWKDVGKVFLVSNIFLVIIGFVNWILGSNYFFIAHKPPTASLLDLLPPWPYYILFIELMGLIFMLIAYTPYAIMDWRASRRRAVEAS